MAKPNVITKEELIEFAKQCLVVNGIEGFTLNAVAQLAGVTQGTVYYHFKTKNQLLLDLVKSICDRSWDELSISDEFVILEAIQSAKSRSSYDSFFHKLFFTLLASGFHHPSIRAQLGEILAKENAVLSERLKTLWSLSPVEGVSMQTWGIVINSLIDGLAIQSLLRRDFPVDEVFDELELLFKALSRRVDGK